MRGCGGGYTLSSHGRLICFNAHDRGICTNRRSIKRVELEARVLDGVKNQMFEAAAFAAFREGYQDEMRRIRQAHMGFEKYYERQYGEATTALQDAIQKYPGVPPPHFWLARTYQAQGRLDDAIAEFLRGGPALTTQPSLYAGLGHLYGISGRRAEALKVLDTMNAMAGQHFVTAYAPALVYLGLGDRSQTLQWLERSYEERASWMIWLLKDPRWDPMRGDPQFEAIVDRVGFPRESRERAR